MATLADESEFMKVLYWGAYGSGKTTAMAHLAKLGHVHWLRIDKGLKALPLRKMGVPVSNIEPHDILLPTKLEKAIEDWRGQLHDKPDAFAGVCIDTMSSLVERRVEVYTDRAWSEYVNRSKKQHTEVDPGMRYSAADVGDIYQPVTQELSRLVRHLTDLPCHVAFSAQIRRDVDKTTGLTMYGPAVNPAVRGSLIGYCDFVIETAPDGVYEDDEDAGVFVGYPRPRLDREGKDRYGVLPRVLVSPTLDRVYGYLKGELESKSDPIQQRYRDTLKARKARQKAEDDEL